MQKNQNASASTFRAFGLHVGLKPHGDRLLTSSGAFWLFGARVLVLAMCLTEAVAWGYLGFLFGQGEEKWLIAAATALVIFLVVWMVDVSLLTLDRASDEHAQKILGTEQRASSLKGRIGLAVAARIFVVLASLTITAPYLAQLVFHKEIQQKIDGGATSKIDAARSVLVARQAEALASAEDAVTQKRDELSAEVSGAGLSRRYGEGPASKALRETVGKLEQERDRLAAAQRQELADFEALAGPWQSNREALAARYDLQLPQASILANRQALEELRKEPEHQQTELAIKAFLLFIFISMLILKFFEPRSIRLYLSDVLQQEYHRYLAGSFDHLLPETEKSTRNPSAMTGQRLLDFLVTVWTPNRAREKAELERRQVKAAAEEDIQRLQTLVAEIQPRLDLAKAAVEKDREACDQAAERYHQFQGAMDLVRGHVATFRSQFQALESGGLDEKLDAQGKAEFGSMVRTNLGKASRKLIELERAKEDEEEKLERTRKARAEAEEALETRKADLRRVEEQIRQAQLLLLNHPGFKSAQPQS